MTTVLSDSPATGTTEPGTDPRDPLLRLTQLLDTAPVPLHPPDTSGAWTCRGTVNGQRVVVYCTDATRMGGAIGGRRAGTSSTPSTSPRANAARDRALALGRRQARRGRRVHARRRRGSSRP